MNHIDTMKLAQKWQQTDWNTESPMSADFAVSEANDVINALIDALREALAKQPAQQLQDTMTIQEVWEAAGGNPGIKATKKDVLLALKLLDAICDEADEQESNRQPLTVDCIGHALDLEAQAKRVESQTVERAMLSAANVLRIIAHHHTK